MPSRAKAAESNEHSALSFSSRSRKEDYQTLVLLCSPQMTANISLDDRATDPTNVILQDPPETAQPPYIDRDPNRNYDGKRPASEYPDGDSHHSGCQGWSEQPWDRTAVGERPANV